MCIVLMFHIEVCKPMSISKPSPKQALVFTCLMFKSFENTVRKGEIARLAIPPFPPVFSTYMENFLPFSSHQKLSSANSVTLEDFKFCRFGKR